MRVVVMVVQWADVDTHEIYTDAEYTKCIVFGNHTLAENALKREFPEAELDYYNRSLDLEVYSCDDYNGDCELIHFIITIFDREIEES